MHLKKLFLFVSIIFSSFINLSCNAIRVQTLSDDPGVLFDYVYNLGNVDDLDFDTVNEFVNENFDKWPRIGCTAFAKTLANGDTVVGRNMDLLMSNQCAYLMKTVKTGKYPTIGVMYAGFIGDDFEVVKNKGVDPIHRMLYYAGSQDVFNSEGLYIECDMRYEEYEIVDEKIEYKWACKGTNPGKKRVASAAIPRYIGMNCKTVREAIDLINNTDVYTMTYPETDMFWNFCYLIADASGDYCVIESVDNQIIVKEKDHKGFSCQTNFYLTEPYTNQAEFKCGVGRFNTVSQNYDDIKSEEDVMKLLNRLLYTLAYNERNTDLDYMRQHYYDPRSEFVDFLCPEFDYVPITYKDLVNEANKEKVNAMLTRIANNYKNSSREERIKNGYWQTIFSTIVNCSKKYMTLRFFEDDSKTIRIIF